MIISDESPLRRLPAGLDRKQMLFFDGIRFSIQMADLSYTRLLTTLKGLAENESSSRDTGAGITSAFLDAWSVIDSCHRLRELVSGLPGMKRNWPSLQILLRRTEKVEALRNIVQHLRREIEKLVSLREPVWGTLGWVSFADDPTRGRSCVIVAGSLFDAEYPVVNPVGKQMVGESGFVTLNAGGVEICLSEVVEEIAKFTARLEQFVSEQFTPSDASGADALLRLEFAFHDPAATNEDDSSPM